MEHDYAKVSRVIIFYIFLYQDTLIHLPIPFSSCDYIFCMVQMLLKWVARYRRDQEFSGRISYSNMYSALNAIAGHYNSFGTTYPLPKKRYDRILQECEVAGRRAY